MLVQIPASATLEAVVCVCACVMCVCVCLSVREREYVWCVRVCVCVCVCVQYAHAYTCTHACQCVHLCRRVHDPGACICLTSKLSKLAKNHDDWANKKSPASTATRVPYMLFTVVFPVCTLYTNVHKQYECTHN